MKKHVIVGCLLIVSSMFVSACGNSSDVTTEKTSVTKQVEATEQSTTSSVDQTKYDAIITEAKKLTAEGQYKESDEYEWRNLHRKSRNKWSFGHYFKL